MRSRKDSLDDVAVKGEWKKEIERICTGRSSQSTMRNPRLNATEQLYSVNKLHSRGHALKYLLNGMVNGHIKENYLLTVLRLTIFPRNRPLRKSNTRFYS